MPIAFRREAAVPAVDRDLAWQRRRPELEPQATGPIDPEWSVRLAHVPPRARIAEPALTEDRRGVSGLDALREEADARALEEPDRPRGPLHCPAVGEEPAGGEPTGARHGLVANVEAAVQRNRADAQTFELGRHPAAPVATVQTLEAVGGRLGLVRRSRGVTTRALALCCSVVPEVHAAVVDIGIEDGQLQEPARGQWHGTVRIPRCRLSVEVRMEVDEQEHHRHDGDNGATSLRNREPEERGDAEARNRE